VAPKFQAELHHRNDSYSHSHAPFYENAFVAQEFTQQAALPRSEVMPEVYWKLGHLGEALRGGAEDGGNSQRLFKMIVNHLRGLPLSRLLI